MVTTIVLLTKNMEVVLLSTEMLVLPTLHLAKQNAYSTSSANIGIFTTTSADYFQALD